MKQWAHSHRTAWAAIAMLCFVGGTAGSLLGARAIAHTHAKEARQAFRLASADVASTLKLAIQHEEDLVTSASTFFAANPQATAAEFDRWASWSGALRRHPELDALALVALVPAQHPTYVPAPRPTALLGTTAGAALSSPAAPATVVGRAGLRRISLGQRTYYCFVIGALSASASARPPTGTDCALAPSLLSTRDSGASRYRTVSLGGEPTLKLDTPVYRGNVPPHTAAGRVSAFVGWLREVLLPSAMLRQALQGHPGEALRLRNRSNSSNAVFSSGTPQSGAQSTTINLHDGWTLRSFVAPVNAGTLTDSDALALLIVGVLLSALATWLIFTGGTGGGAWNRAPADGEQLEGSLYDALTGLPNRALTLDRADFMLARTGRQPGMLAGALLVDVDWFKDVNDKLGRAAGDQLLGIVAERLRSVVRADDTVGRFGEDKFMALVESQARGVRLDSLAGRMIEALHKPVELDGFGPSFHMTASIGVAFGRYTSTDDLLRDTEVALRAAKSAGKDRFTLFNANLRSVIEDRGVLDAELNAALQDKQFFLLYEPIYDLSTHKVAGFEALIHWMHPKRGALPPADFLPIAEETGLIVPIDRWALEEACTRAAAWNVAGDRVGISVNVSANQLNREGFISDVRRALQQSGLEASLLTLEIAEGAIIGDIATAAELLGEIKRLGVCIAIENFGSGYAYRSDLQRLPLDFLKIDRGSLAAADDEDYRSWLLEAIVLFARDLSLTVIAEGVETSEHLTRVEAMGCTMVQGPLMGKPSPTEAVESVLRAGFPAAPAASTTPAPAAPTSG